MNKPANPYSARPASKPLPIGIDFGTTNSAMSKYSQSLLNNGPVSFNFPITGGVLYPSMALLDCETGTIRTGNAAYTHRLTDPGMLFQVSKERYQKMYLTSMQIRHLQAWILLKQLSQIL